MKEYQQKSSETLLEKKTDEDFCEKNIRRTYKNPKILKNSISNSPFPFLHFSSTLIRNFLCLVQTDTSNHQCMKIIRVYPFLYSHYYMSLILPKRPLCYGSIAEISFLEEVTKCPVIAKEIEKHDKNFEEKKYQPFRQAQNESILVCKQQMIQQYKCKIVRYIVREAAKYVPE